MSAPDVAIVSPYPEVGARHGGASGVAGYTANLARSVAAAGARVTVVAPRGDGAATEDRDGDVRVWRAFDPGPRSLPDALASAAATGARTIHLQHELFLYGGPAALPGLVPALRRGRRGGRRLVVTMHQVVDPRTVDEEFTRLHGVELPVRVARWGLASVQSLVRRGADEVVVHEQAFTDLVPGAVRIPHGLDAPEPIDRDRERRRLGLADGELTVLCFGFVAPYKGLELALEAAVRAGPPVRLVVAGAHHPRQGTGYLDDLRARYEPRGVRFTGHVDDADVGPWFRATDVALCCHPRPHASSGPAALAIAHGTPLLLSPGLAACLDAPPELVVPLDPDGVADRLRALAADAAARQRLADAVAPLAGERRWPSVAARHLELYR